jgi:hypothetical protein
MADAVEAAWQDMEQEATDELVRRERHDALKDMGRAELPEPLFMRCASTVRYRLAIKVLPGTSSESRNLDLCS